MANIDKYVFRPDVRMIMIDDDTVELRTGVWNASSLTLHDDSEKGLLAAMLQGFWTAGSQVVETSARASMSSDDGGLVEMLLTNKLLIPKNQADAANILPFLSGMHAQWDASVSQSTTINIISPDRLGDLFTAIIPEEQRASITRVDAATRQALLNKDLFGDMDVIGSMDHLIRFDAWAGSLVVLIWPDINPVLVNNINQLAHRVGFRFLPAFTDGPFALIGPCVFPGLTPCFACAEARVVDAMRDHTLYMHYKQSLMAGKVLSHDQDIIHPFHSCLVSIVGMEVLNIVMANSPYTSGKIMTLYGPTFEVKFHELVMVPGCPVCGTRPGLDKPLYSDLQAYIRAHYDNHKVTVTL